MKQSKANPRGKNICPRKRKHRSTTGKEPERVSRFTTYSNSARDETSSAWANTQSKVRTRVPRFQAIFIYKMGRIWRDAPSVSFFDQVRVMNYSFPPFCLRDHCGPAWRVSCVSCLFVDIDRIDFMLFYHCVNQGLPDIRGGGLWAINSQENIFMSNFNKYLFYRNNLLKIKNFESLN